MNKKLSTQRLTMTALFTALTCVLTIAVRIPIAATSGYIHMGDAMVIISGIILGPVGGACAAGLGSAFADVTGGYLIYAPVTFLIKGLVALSAGMFYKLIRKEGKKSYLCVLLGGIADVLFVCGGYFLYENILYGAEAATLSLTMNFIQAIGGLVGAFVLYSAIPKNVYNVDFNQYEVRRRK